MLILALLPLLPLLGPSTPATSPSAPVVTVTGYDYAFTAPDTLRAGATTFRFVDKGKFDHHLIVFRLDPTVTLSQFHARLKDGGESPPGIASLGGLQTDKMYARTDRPGPRDFTVVLKPGRYVLACLHAEEGVSHLEKGMMRELTVIPSRQAEPTPRFDATLEMSDYKYALSRRVSSGTRTLRIVNTGAQEHHFFMQRMRPGKTLADIRAHQAARAKERVAGDSTTRLVPPQIPFTAVTRMSPGEVGYVTLDLEAGDYRLFCLVPDAKDGKPHTQHGMDQMISIGR